MKLIRNLLLPLMVTLSLTSCQENRIPSIPGAPDLFVGPCISFWSWGTGEQLVDLSGLPLAPSQPIVKFQTGTEMGPAIHCYRQNATTGQRLSEPVNTPIDPTQPMVCLSVDDWRSVLRYFKLYIRRKVGAFIDDESMEVALWVLVEAMGLEFRD